MRPLSAFVVVIFAACSQESTEKSIEAALVRRGGPAELQPAPGTLALQPSEVLSKTAAFGMPYRQRCCAEFKVRRTRSNSPPRLHHADVIKLT